MNIDVKNVNIFNHFEMKKYNVVMYVLEIGYKYTNTYDMISYQTFGAFYVQGCILLGWTFRLQIR